MPPFWESRQARADRERAEHERHIRAVQAKHPVFGNGWVRGLAVYTSFDHVMQEHRGKMAPIHFIKAGRQRADGYPEYLLQTHDGQEVRATRQHEEYDGWFRTKDLRMVPNSLNRPPSYHEREDRGYGDHDDRGPPPAYRRSVEHRRSDHDIPRPPPPPPPPPYR
ncbi:hypothetical protein N7G274_000146 [Stereocaulon virgatum]|uniref:Uncharacterized protein n=1 Tax=Stereocaulon virgatum TaxID=373712 RepID=A0ABR4AS08_9LECA